MGPAIALSLLPAIALFTTFFLAPLVVLVVTSLTEWNGNELDFIGLENYTTILSDDTFWKAATNTLFYCATGVLIQVPLGVFTGIMLSQRRAGWRIFRALIFIPYVISGAAYALIFALFYNPRYGLLNSILASVGLDSDTDWLASSATALPAVAATLVFVIGFHVIVVMAEIASFPDEIYEAAELDGASVLQRHIHLTVPLLRNVIGTLVLITLLSYIALFDLVYILTSGGPNDATKTLTLYGYNAYVNSAWGYANAVGAIIVLIGLVLIVGTRRAFRIGERTL